MSIYMNVIDPTYLRTIHDGLLSGAMHKDNASSLPMGLVGMYEEALPPATNVNERKKFLEFFSLWALLKNEVSTNFVLQFLFWWNEEEILEYISKYANWFNSPSNGKYILYHQRLRSFLLARMSDVDSKNNDLLAGLLELDSLSGSGEFKNYLEEFYGDHLLISLQFNGSEESFNKLKSIDDIIDQRQWRVNSLNRLRWNEMSVSIACYELDLPLLKNLYTVQDRILNKKMDLSLLFNQISDGDFSEFEERLLFAESDVEKCYLLFYVIIELTEGLTEKKKIETHQITLLNYLVERVNKIHGNGIWIIPMEILTLLNERVLNITLGEKQLTTQIQVSNFHDESMGDIPEWIHSTEQILFEELVLTIDFCADLMKIEVPKLESEIKKKLKDFVSNELRPEYKSDATYLDDLLIRIKDYKIENDENFEDLISIFHSIVTHSGYSTFDGFDNFDHDVKELIFKLLIRFPSSQNSYWIQSFIDSYYWVDTIKYFVEISKLINNPKIGIHDFYSQTWQNRENFVSAALSISAMVSNLVNVESGYSSFRELIKRYLDYSYSSVSENWLESIRINDSELTNERKELNQSKFDLLLEQYSNYQFRHIPTLSNILSEKFDLLELISFLRDNITHYSDVAMNKELITDLLKGLIVALGFSGTKEYIIGALEKYVPIMGGYGAYDYEFEYNRPSENTWSIEWWVIGDVVYEFTQIAESMEKELYLDYSNNFGDCDYETLLNEGFFYNEIETVFANNNFSPEDNLYRVIDDFMSIRPQKNYRNRLPDILFNYKVNPTRTLLRFGEISKDRQMLNCLARTISKEY
jgi:hypothetical protein